MIDNSCNAVIKQGGKLLICDKQLGHVAAGDDEHAMGDRTWRDEPW